MEHGQPVHRPLPLSNASASAWNTGTARRTTRNHRLIWSVTTLRPSTALTPLSDPSNRHFNAPGPEYSNRMLNGMALPPSQRPEVFSRFLTSFHDTSFYDHPLTAFEKQDLTQLVLEPDESHPKLRSTIPEALRKVAYEPSQEETELWLGSCPAAAQASLLQIKTAYSRSNRLSNTTIRHVCCANAAAGSPLAYWASQEIASAIEKPRCIRFKLFNGANHFAHYDQPLETLRAWLGVKDPLDQVCRDFVSSLRIRPLPHRPWVTMTYAQSLDGRIAANEGDCRLMLSGQESMQMTFRLREKHQAILVTAATLNADDSQLTG